MKLNKLALWLPLALLPVSLAWGEGSAPVDNSQKWQVTPFVGYSSSLDFDSSDETTNVSAKENQNWGLFISKETPDPGMMELIYSHESTDLSPEQSDKLSIDYLHFAGALTLADGVRPYVGAGIGFTRLAAYDSSTRPSLALALGVQPRLSDNIALRAEVRGYGTFINDNSEFICNPEICALRVKGEMLTQVQANIGITARF
jgi:opacity protein-like surface antigen